MTRKYNCIKYINENKMRMSILYAVFFSIIRDFKAQRSRIAALTNK